MRSRRFCYWDFFDLPVARRNVRSHGNVLLQRDCNSGNADEFLISGLRGDSKFPQIRKNPHSTADSLKFPHISTSDRGALMRR